MLHNTMASSSEESGIEWGLSEGSFSVRAASSLGSGGARSRAPSLGSVGARAPPPTPLLDRWRPLNQPVNFARLAANWRLQRHLRR